MKCTGCGSHNPENAQFCGGCGVSLSASTPTAVGIDAAELPMVDFGTAVKLGFQRYVDFSGRSTRAEYWRADIADLVAIQTAPPPFSLLPKLYCPRGRLMRCEG